MKMVYNRLPLSEGHSQGFGYRDYFTKKGHGKSLFIIMKKLALNGPTSKYDLSCLANKEKSKAATSFSWPQVHKLITQLIGNGLIREYGKRKLNEDLMKKGKKHKNVALYGLTDLGILLTCLTDEEVYAETDTILNKYDNYDDKQKIVGILQLVKDPIPELNVNDQARKERRTVFNSDRLKGVRNDEDVYNHFFETLAWILYDCSAEYSTEELEKIRNLMKKKGIYDEFLKWFDDRLLHLKKEIEMKETESRNFEYTAEWLRE